MSESKSKGLTEEERAKRTCKSCNKRGHVSKADKRCELYEKRGKPADEEVEEEIVLSSDDEHPPENFLRWVGKPLFPKHMKKMKVFVEYDGVQVRLAVQTALSLRLGCSWIATFQLS